jgi:hypothetical protein
MTGITRAKIPRFPSARWVTGSGSDTVTYFVADVQLADATQLQNAFANNSFGRNIIANTSAIAQQNNAIFAINGDYYGFRTRRHRHPQRSCLPRCAGADRAGLL